ncbi:MAG: hypothetical protein P4M13_11225 [Alphaproteobacteria bacterium]|nr:hypothetical protein [Alphaproteobacteria bacterium]
MTQEKENVFPYDGWAEQAKEIFKNLPERVRAHIPSCIEDLAHSFQTLAPTQQILFRIRFLEILAGLDLGERKAKTDDKAPQREFVSGVIKEARELLDYRSS